MATRTRYRGYTRPDGRDPARVIDSVAVPLDDIDADMNAIAVPGAASAATARRLGTGALEAARGSDARFTDATDAIGAWRPWLVRSGLLGEGATAGKYTILGNGQMLQPFTNVDAARGLFTLPEGAHLGRTLVGLPGRSIEYQAVLTAYAWALSAPDVQIGWGISAADYLTNVDAAGRLDNLSARTVTMFSVTFTSAALAGGPGTRVVSPTWTHPSAGAALPRWFFTTIYLASALGGTQNVLLEEMLLYRYAS